MRLERFTDVAQEAFQEAQEIMHEQHHTQLDVEHIFLTMIRQPGGTTARVLGHLGVNPAEIVKRLEHELQKMPKVYGQYGYGNQIYITPRTQRLVKRAEDVATEHKVGKVGIEHLLIALSSERDGLSAGILRDVGIDQERLAGAVAELGEELRQGEQAAPAQPSASPGEYAALRQRIAALEQQNRHLQELLKMTQENLAYTRGLLEKEIGLRHWAERRRIEREGGPEGQTPP